MDLTPTCPYVIFGLFPIEFASSLVLNRFVQLGYEVLLPWADHLLQYPMTDRKNEESPTSPSTPPDVGNSNRVRPNRSSVFALGYEI